MHWLSSWPSLSWCSSSLCPLYTGLLIVQNNVASALFWTMSSGAVAVPTRPLSEPRKYTFSGKKNQFSSSFSVLQFGPKQYLTFQGLVKCALLCVLFTSSPDLLVIFASRQLLIAHAELSGASVYGVACANLFLAHFFIIVLDCTKPR